MVLEQEQDMVLEVEQDMGMEQVLYMVQDLDITLALQQVLEKGWPMVVDMAPEGDVGNVALV